MPRLTADAAALACLQAKTSADHFGPLALSVGYMVRGSKISLTALTATLAKPGSRNDSPPGDFVLGLTYGESGAEVACHERGENIPITTG